MDCYAAILNVEPSFMKCQGVSNLLSRKKVEEAYMV